MFNFHIFHHWHPTGNEKEQHKIDYFCNRIYNLFVELECCKCHKLKWVKYKYWC